MLDADSDGFLAGREMAEAANLLFFIKSVCGEFEASSTELTKIMEDGMLTESIYLIVIISLYSCRSSRFVVSNVYGGGSSSYVSKLSSGIGT